METFLYILLALIVLLVLITVHELGHYIAGKIFGFKINEFAIGFGPAIFKRVNKKTGEIFSIRALPLGGFCAFEGEDEDNPGQDAFNNQKPWKRLIVLVSGVLFNFVFGVITATIFLMCNGYALPRVNDFAPVAGGVNPNDGLLLKNDLILEVNGKTIEAYRTINDVLKGIEEGEEITFVVQRNGEEQTITGVKKYKTDDFFFVANISAVKDKVYSYDGTTATLLSPEQVNEYIKAIKPVYDETEKKFKDFSFGENPLYKKVVHEDQSVTYEAYTDEEFRSEDFALVTLSRSTSSVGFIFINEQAHYGFFECMLKAWPFCFYICGLILAALGGIFTGATGLAELGGTITAVSQIAEISKLGVNQFLLLLPMLSMNLALFNILPIPALDGARCVFVGIEWIFKKPVPRKVENIIHTVGLFVLLGIVVFLDVYHFFILPRL